MEIRITTNLSERERNFFETTIKYLDNEVKKELISLLVSSNKENNTSLLALNSCIDILKAKKIINVRSFNLTNHTVSVLPFHPYLCRSMKKELKKVFKQCKSCKIVIRKGSLCNCY